MHLFHKHRWRNEDFFMRLTCQTHGEPCHLFIETVVCEKCGKRERLGHGQLIVSAPSYIPSVREVHSQAEVARMPLLCGNREERDDARQAPA